MDTAVILPISNQPGYYAFSCPGCRCGHKINISPANHGPRWTLTGTPESPTIRASVLVRGGYYDSVAQVDKVGVCHSFVTNGDIEFLSDCTHELAGQTVPLPVL